MRIFMFFVYFLIALFGISFAVLNAQASTVNLYFTSITLPISLLLALTFGLGVIIGASFIFMKYWRLKIQFKKLQSKYNIKDQEIKNLRSIPFSDKH